jgi:hypothetical protein
MVFGCNTNADTRVNKDSTSSAEDFSWIRACDQVKVIVCFDGSQFTLQCFLAMIKNGCTYLFLWLLIFGTPLSSFGLL